MFFQTCLPGKVGVFYEKYGTWLLPQAGFLPLSVPLFLFWQGLRLPVAPFFDFEPIGDTHPTGLLFGQEYPHLMNYSIWFLLAILLLTAYPVFKIINPFRRNNRA
ncbi:MAG: hypothetical protein ACM3P1_12785 [Candidatus Saccharibacteria bacterium]